MKKKKKKRRKEERRRRREEGKEKKSIIKVMLSNVFFVTHKGLKTTLCASVLGGFLVEILTFSDDSMEISAKLGKEISCTLNGDDRFCFFPENLVNGTCANLSINEFAKIVNSGNSGGTLFTMKNGVFTCEKLDVNGYITEEILECLLSDMDSLYGIIDDFMIPKDSKEERPDAVKKGNENEHSFAGGKRLHQKGIQEDE